MARSGLEGICRFAGLLLLVQLRLGAIVPEPSWTTTLEEPFDAAEYVVWHKTGGTQFGYDT